MIGALSIMRETPCIVHLLNDDGLDFVVVEPLQFIPASEIGKYVVHADLTTQEGARDHG